MGGSFSFSISFSYSNTVTDPRTVTVPLVDRQSDVSGPNVHIISGELPVVSDKPNKDTTGSSVEATSTGSGSDEGTTDETDEDTAMRDSLGKDSAIRGSSWEISALNGDADTATESGPEPSGTGNSASSVADASKAGENVADNDVQLGTATRDSGNASASTSSNFGPGKTATVAVVSICAALLIGYVTVWKVSAARGALESTDW